MLKENIFIQSEISIHEHFNLEQKVSYFLTLENKTDIKSFFQQIIKKTLNKYSFDHKIRINVPDYNTPIGNIKEYFKFIDYDTIPDKIQYIHSQNEMENLHREIIGENIFLYKKKIKLYSSQINKTYPDILALADIVRINIKDFLDKIMIIWIIRKECL